MNDDQEGSGDIWVPTPMVAEVQRNFTIDAVNQCQPTLDPLPLQQYPLYHYPSRSHIHIIIITLKLSSSIWNQRAVHAQNEANSLPAPAPSHLRPFFSFLKYDWLARGKIRRDNNGETRRRGR